MAPALRRLAFGLVLAGPLLAGASAPASVAAQSCDPSYPDFCIPPPSEVGDLDCADVAGAMFTVYQPDPHYFDGDYDGYGCEWN